MGRERGRKEGGRGGRKEGGIEEGREGRERGRRKEGGRERKEGREGGIEEGREGRERGGTHNVMLPCPSDCDRRSVCLREHQSGVEDGAADRRWL